MSIVAIWEIVKAVAAIGADLAKTRLGNIVVAFAIAWIWSAHRQDAACEARFAAERAAREAAYAQELAREHEAAERIARDATQRAGEDAIVARAMQSKIDDYAAKERTANVSSARIAAPGAAPRPCLADGDFARVLRELDAAGDRKAATARRAR